MTPDFYVLPGTLTALTAEQASAVGHLDSNPEALCRVVQGVVIQPQEAERAGLPDARLEERNLRPVSVLLRILMELDGSPITQPRSPDRRVVGACRHFAVMACALLRAHGLPARARCGFATYFDLGKHVDHWITEYWSGPDDGWVRVDPEILGTGLVARPHRLADGEFLTGGEAWKLCRAGSGDPMTLASTSTCFLS